MNNGWQSRLASAVSPLQDGISPLRVYGFSPDTEEGHRPSRTAAVLVPILDLPKPELVLTRRADHLNQHPGQVSFPGGGIDHAEETAVETALREAEEEIGLSPSTVTLLGFLDRLDTISDYRVLPVVGLVSPVPEWRLDEREVAEVFTVPLEVVLDRERFERREIERDGVIHTIYSLQWRNKLIWGVTAAMLINLQKRLRLVGGMQ